MSARKKNPAEQPPVEPSETGGGSDSDAVIDQPTDSTADPATESASQSTTDSAQAGGERATDASQAQSFGDAAAEMANETEVEEPPQPVEAGETADELTLANIQIATLTGDLQRLQAEYLNYKRRVDRDRELVQQNARVSALASILEVLDTIDRAREHGPLEDGLGAVADQLERAVSNQGLTKFGAPGDEFDPMLHEALSHLGTDDEVSVVTCKVIARAGYRIGERVVRAAQVLVVDPA